MWLLVVVFLFDPGQIRYRASVRLSSCFFYLLTHHNLYSPNEIAGYAPEGHAIEMTKEEGKVSYSLKHLHTHAHVEAHVAQLVRQQ